MRFPFQVPGGNGGLGAHGTKAGCARGEPLGRSVYVDTAALAVCVVSSWPCAVGTSTCPVIAVLLSWTLASTATIGHRAALPQLPCTTPISMLLVSTRRMARTIAITVPLRCVIVSAFGAGLFNISLRIKNNIIGKCLFVLLQHAQCK